MNYSHYFNQPYPTKAVINRLILGAIVLILSLSMIALTITLYLIFFVNELYTWFIVFGIMLIPSIVIKTVIHNALFGVFLASRQIFIKSRWGYVKLFIALVVIDFILMSSIFFISGNLLFISEKLPTYDAMITILVIALIVAAQACILCIKTLPKV